METADPELLDLFEKDRLKLLTPEETALKERRLKDPTTKAIWADLERIARAWATKQPRTLPEDFSARVMAEIGRREASAPAGKPVTVGKVVPGRGWIRPAAGLSVAAGLLGVAIGHWVIPAAGPELIGAGGVAYLCELKSATVEGKSHPLDEIDQSGPQSFEARGHTVPAEVRILAPEARICVAKGEKGCTDWQPAPSAVLIYGCRMKIYRAPRPPGLRAE